jgi:hypothetical protein
LADDVSHIEEEVRFLLARRGERAPVRISASESTQNQRTELVDIWYVPGFVATYDEHESWLATGKAAPVRIRFSRSSEGGGVMEVKRLVKPGNFGYAREVSIEVSDLRAADAFLILAGFIRAALITKTRLFARHAGGLILCIDDYGELGVVLEVERAEDCRLPDGPGSLRSWARGEFGEDLEELIEPIALQAIRQNLLVAEAAQLGGRSHLVSEADFYRCLNGL